MRREPTNRSIDLLSPASLSGMALGLPPNSPRISPTPHRAMPLCTFSTLDSSSSDRRSHNFPGQSALNAVLVG